MDWKKERGDTASKAAESSTTLWLVQKQICFSSGNPTKTQKMPHLSSQAQPQNSGVVLAGHTTLLRCPQARQCDYCSDSFGIVRRQALSTSCHAKLMPCSHDGFTYPGIVGKVPELVINS